MKINSIQQQNYNRQSFQAVKNPAKVKPIIERQILNVEKQANNVSTKGVKELSFVQKIKEAWKLVNKLQ
jgi:hypothetical protein